MVENNDVVEAEASKRNENGGTGGQDNVEGVRTDAKKGAIPPKDDEPKVDFKTLPFPQRFIRRSLDK